jgi:hypothetical protein
MVFYLLQPNWYHCNDVSWQSSKEGMLMYVLMLLGLDIEQQCLMAVE